MPAMSRLIAVAALLLVGASANLAARSEPPAQWLPLLVVAVAGAVVAGAPSRLWPLPAFWLVATLLVTTTGVLLDASMLVVSLGAGAVAMVAAVLVDVLPVLRDRRRRVHP
jgi:hypothetical protein